MPQILDMFGGSAFSVLELTQAVNIIPNRYGRVGQLGVFRSQPVSTTSVAVEYMEGKLNLLQTGQRGAPAPVNTTGKRKLRNFTVPHLPLEDLVTAEELQNVRPFGMTTAPADPVRLKVNEKLLAMSQKHFITWEFWRAGALNGQILDADGGVILDLFAEFGVTRKTVSFALSSDTTKVVTKCLEVKRHIEDNLLGDVMDHVHALCSPGFWDAFTTHKAVEEAYKYWQGLQSPLRQDLRAGFEFAGVVFEEYRGQAATAAGATHKFIPEDAALFFPVGTQDSLVEYVAPADFIETVNTMGLPLYAKQAVDEKYQRFVSIHTQSNHLPLCHRPALLVKGTK